MEVVAIPVVVLLVITAFFIGALCFMISAWLNLHNEADAYRDLFPPGEVIDRITIEDAKNSHILGYKEIYRSKHDSVDIIIDRTLTDGRLRTRLHTLWDQLSELNARQWDWEDRVRSEESAEAAVGARRNNTERVRIKNKINELFGAPREVKQYKGEGYE
jgi:hypothetical protein